jgi:hypothetical protein
MAPGVKFPITVSSGSSLSKTIIGIRIDLVFAVNLNQVTATLTHRLASLDDDGTHPVADALQSGKKSSRPGSHYVHFRGIDRNGLKINGFERSLW